MLNKVGQLPLYRVVTVTYYRGPELIKTSTYHVIDMQDTVVCICEKKHNAELIAQLLEKHT
jgi:hypothetical protein